MSQQFIQEVEHVAVEPVRIERDANDVVIVEGVRYSGEYFRTLAVPNTDVLYAIRRDGEQVWLTVIRNVVEARTFFEGLDVTLTPSLSLKGEGEEDGGA